MSPVQIELRDTSFDPFQELFQHRKTFSEIGDHGACSTFVGTMRKYNGGDRVLAMQLEHYPGMTEKQLEEIVGEIRDEHDDTKPIEPTINKIDEFHVEVDGRFPLDDLNDELSVQLPEDEEYDTIAGFVLANLGHVPRVGEILETHGMSITTLEATDTQIDRLSIEISETQE